MSWWTYRDGDRTIQLRLMLHGTNDSSTDALIVSRVQVRRAGWFSKEPWQDCIGVEIGNNRLTPMFVGVPLPALTTTVFRIIHHYKSERPEPKQPIKCSLRVTDQHGRFHYARLTVPSR
jgi:hypothetical protein